MTQSIRIASVQAGDYIEARDRLAAGGDETYRGQRHTTAALAELVRGVPHLVVSTGAKHPKKVEGDGTYVSSTPIKMKLVPTRWREKLRARKIIRELEAFKPTHLLLRVSDVLGCEVLAWGNRRNLPTAINIAACFRTDNPVQRRFCTLANASNVLLVGNHNRVATQSLVDCGLKPDKAVAWDQPPTIKPSDYAPRTMPEGTPRVVFAGSLIEAKGAGDLVKAAEIAGGAFCVTICGDGPIRAQLALSEAVAKGWVELAGKIPNGEVVRRMREAAVVCVPTRHSFAEALPLVLQEGLAVRTPLLLSDHPVFQSYFRDGQGVRFFAAGDAGSLANVMQEIIRDESRYADLSRQTESAWQSFQIDTTFGDVLKRIGKAWGVPSST